jgi:tyrosinase
LEITEFSQDRALVDALRTGIAAMRNITDQYNTGSYKYWHFSHWMPLSNPPEQWRQVFDQCKHAASFFISWHRGFLYFFERALRKASNNPLFALPYWDYYKNPNIPEIFLQPTLHDGSPNPLYWPNRERTSVTGLSFSAFADTVKVFPWGPGETFEDLCERNPHNRVHDQIGGSMGAVPTAPADPVFWLHHCNVDRYWSAWIAAGREMPPAHDTLFWQQRFEYDLGGSWSLSVEEMNDSKNLGYTYSDVRFPTAPRDQYLPPRPPVVAVGPTNSAGPIALDMRAVTVEIPLDDAVAASASVDVVLEGVQLTELGKRGGYDYSVYANLPEVRVPVAKAAEFEIGEFGSFILTMPSMNGMMMPSGARTLRFVASPRARNLLLSFVGYGGASGVSATAELVRIERIRITPR